MYHEEKLIDGILFWRGTPKGDWIPFTLKQMTEKFLEAEKNHQELKSIIEGEIAWT